MHDYLSQFLSYNKFPKGPLILRDVGLSKKKALSLQEGDKYKSIKTILEAYPNMKFVLIGDSAEFDTEIYLDLARNYTTQIKAIFIRTVKSKKRVRRVKRVIEATQDVYIRLIQDAEEAIAKAKELDLID